MLSPKSFKVCLFFLSLSHQFYGALLPFRDPYIGKSSKKIYLDMFNSCSYPDKEWWVLRSFATSRLQLHWPEHTYLWVQMCPGTSACRQKGPCHWVNILAWWRPSPATRNWRIRTPLRPNISLTISGTSETLNFTSLIVNSWPWTLTSLHLALTVDSRNLPSLIHFWLSNPPEYSFEYWHSLGH